METCDVLIVGGGPAGSSCAWKLRQAGVNVVVLDKNQFPRNKVCAGWITPPVIDELELSIEDYCLHGVLQAITGFITGMIDGPEIETNYHRIVSYGIRRFEFDDYLLRRTNARLRLGEAFRSIRREKDDWIVNEELRSPIVVGAGGHFCPVARAFCLRDDPTQPAEIASSTHKPTVVAQENEFEMTESQQRHCSVLPNRPELFFCRDLKGYGWIFRKGNYLNIGLGREDESQLSVHIAEFVRSLVSHNKIPSDLPGHFHGHAYRLRTVLPQPTTQSHILLIGDAAGLAHRNSGEGIHPAITSGLLAAASIIESDGKCSEDLGALYAEKLRQRFDVPSRPIPLNWIPVAMHQFAARWLMQSPMFTRRILLDRWFLHVERQYHDGRAIPANAG